MSMLLLQTFLLMLTAFFLGAFVACLIKSTFFDTARDVVAEAPMPRDLAVAKPRAEPAATLAPAAAPRPALEPVRPKIETVEAQRFERALKEQTAAVTAPAPPAATVSMAPLATPAPAVTPAPIVTPAPAAKPVAAAPVAPTSAFATPVTIKPVAPVVSPPAAPVVAPAPVAVPVAPEPVASAPVAPAAAPQSAPLPVRPQAPATSAAGIGTAAAAAVAMAATQLRTDDPKPAPAAADPGPASVMPVESGMSGQSSVSAEVTMNPVAPPVAPAPVNVAPVAPVATPVETPLPAQDLTRIRGIDNAMQARLHGFGIRRYDEIAAWKFGDVERVGTALGIGGRITQENWIEQAQVLAKGGVTHFALRIDRGELETSKPQEGTTSTIDEVVCSVFSRPRVARGIRFPIQALLHLQADRLQAARLASLVDTAANRRAFATLDIKIPRGETVEFFLECPELLIEQPLQTLVWEGRAGRSVFMVEVATDAVDRTISATLVAGVNGILVGELKFEIHVATPMTLQGEISKTRRGGQQFFVDEGPVAGSEAPNYEQQFIGTRADRYERAFVSYSRRDFSVVSFFAQGLAEKGYAPIVDISDLEPGDDWEGKLPKLVTNSDVVYVMWSDNAAKSKWVDFETKLAAELNAMSPTGRPRIKPIPLQHPWPQAPSHLARFQFYSIWQGHRAAHQIGLIRKSDITV